MLKISALWLWIWFGPAVLGLFARRPWVTALVFALNAAVVALLLSAPDLGLVVLAALYAAALVTVIVSRRHPRPPLDPNAQRLLAEVRRLNARQLDYR